MVAVSDRSEPLGISLAALGFFALDADMQISIAEKHFDQEVPAMFWGERRAPRYSDVFLSIGCIYFTARQAFLDEYGEVDEIFELYGDFHHRLTWMLGEGEEEWVEQAVRSNETWARLRQDAQKLLNSIGCSANSMAIRFNLLEQFSPAEFKTSKEESEHMDYLLSKPDIDEPGKT